MEARRDKEVLHMHFFSFTQNGGTSVVAVAFCFVCDVHAHTPQMTHPKPRPARIPFESLDWHVRLRGTNALMLLRTT